MRANDVSVTVTIDTEEDNWGSYHESGATTENISYLEELQDHFERWGARATYLVNRPPLMSSASVETLGRLATREDVEVGGHCHPWNSPPATGEGIEKSMMCNLPTEANRAKIADVRLRIETELGVQPTSFRAGRWGFGPTVSKALAAEGFTVDASVTPLIDWSPDGGPDYTFADPAPYRFDPNAPFQADGNGTMVQIPTTVSFLRGDHFRMARLRAMLGKGPAKRLHAIGVSNAGAHVPLMYTVARSNAICPGRQRPSPLPHGN